MKMIFTALLLLSCKTWSCPELSGNYSKCTNLTAKETSSGMKVEQKIVNGVTIYKFGGNPRDYIANGKEQIFKGSKYTESCRGEELHSKQNHSKSGEEFLEEVIISKEGNKLNTKSNKIINGKSSTIHIVCE